MDTLEQLKKERRKNVIWLFIFIFICIFLAASILRSMDPPSPDNAYFKLIDNLSFAVLLPLIFCTALVGTWSYRWWLSSQAIKKFNSRKGTAYITDSAKIVTPFDAGVSVLFILYFIFCYIPLFLARFLNFHYTMGGVGLFFILVPYFLAPLLLLALVRTLDDISYLKKINASADVVSRCRIKLILVFLAFAMVATEFLRLVSGGH